MSEMFQKCQDQYNRKLPFVLYRKPNARKVIALLQSDEILHKVRNYEEKGFVFAPFIGQNRIIFPVDKCEVSISSFDPIGQKLPAISKVECKNPEAEQKHIDLVNKAITSIKNGEFSKVVLSRQETLAIPDFDLIETFQKLASTYASAFAYCFYHPKVGLWLGAFSEQLVFVKGKNFQTMAVAGTQLYNENATAFWEDKEMNEQQLVTDFLVSNLNDISIEINVSNPYMMRAGNLIHLKTDIEGEFREEIQLKELLSILHPTPAVCGFPKVAAMDFIINNEGYDRSFYAGFLGELNFDFETKENTTDLYVNLRCMQVKENLAHIYVGGGITIDSNAEIEWLETVNKSQTIKKILY
jgi:isochorismate synthase